MPEIFISYSRDEQARARLFANALEREGFSVWWDVTLRSGEAFDEAIERALRAAKAVISSAGWLSRSPPRWPAPLPLPSRT